MTVSRQRRSNLKTFEASRQSRVRSLQMQFRSDVNRRSIYRSIKKRSYWDYIFICLIGLISISWFDGDRLIAVGDFWFPTDGISYFHEITSTWIDTMAMGVANFKGTAAAVYGLYVSITDSIGLSSVASEKMLFYCLFISAGLSMYYLTHVIGLGRPWRLLAALFFMMNPVAINQFGTPFTYLAYGCAPLLLGLYINGLEKGKGLKYILFLALVWTLIMSSSYVDPGYLIMHVGVLCLYLLYHVAVHRNSKTAIQGIKFTSTLFAFVVLLNAFWLIPLSSGFESEVAKSTVPVSNNEAIYKSLSADLPDAVQLLGYDGYQGEYKGDTIFPWASWYFRTPTIIIGFLISAIALLSLLWRGVGRKHMYYFGLLLVAGLILQTGSNPPFGDPTLWFIKETPYFMTSFRNPLKFQLLVSLALAPLLGVGLSMIFKYLTERCRRVLLSALLVTVFFIFGIYYPWPMWAGTVFQEGGDVLPSAKVQIPQYYSEAREWLNDSEEDFRIFPLPYSTNYLNCYNWQSGYNGLNVDRLLLDSPTIAMNDGTEGYQIPLQVASEIEEGFPGDYLTRLLELLRVKYILMHRDTNWNYIDGDPSFFDHDLERLEFFLDTQSQLHLAKSFGSLEFYSVGDNTYVPHIYASTTATLVNGGLDNFADLLSIPKYDIRSATFISDSNLASRLDHLVQRLTETREYEILETNLPENTGADFESGNFESWTTRNMANGTVRVTNLDSTQGDFAAEIVLPSHGRESGVYKDFGYDGRSPINISASMKIVSQEPPSGSSIYVYGYDANDVEKVRIIYHMYDNWDWPTGSPADMKHGTDQDISYYVLRHDLGDPPLDTWINVNRNPKDEFEERYPGIWDSLNLNRIRVELTAWGDAPLVSRYDDVQTTNLIPGYFSYNSLRLSEESNHTPVITYEKVNPTKYKVHINTSDPFFLIFSESYNSQWKAYINKTGDSTNWIEALYQNPLPEDIHLQSNGYANTWYIDEAGQYDITLYFRPQSLFYVGAVISCITFGICFIYLTWSQLRHRIPIRKKR